MVKQVRLRDYEVRIRINDTREEKVHNVEGRNLDDAMKDSAEKFKHLYDLGKYSVISIMEVAP